MTAFWILGAIVVASAVWTITARKPVYSVVALLVNFAALAVIYITLTAEFLAVMQIIVYSGAILVLFVFVIALLSSGVAPFSAGPNRMKKSVALAAFIVLVAFGFLSYALASFVPPAQPAIVPPGTVPGPDSLSAATSADSFVRNTAAGKSRPCQRMRSGP